MLRLTLFGEFSAAGADGTEIAVKSKKARALLAYLALSPKKSRSREEIMALLWSDRGEAQARASLRQVLVGLRKDLGEAATEALIVTNEAVALDPGRLTIEAANQGEELLAGFHLHDPAFEDWLRDELLRHEDVTPSPQPPEPPPPDRPSIAVLPFTNLSADPEQEYFSDGITEDIITALAHFRDVSVIARNSSFSFKGQSPDVKEIGRKLGAQYVVEGSVRKVGAKVRITAQLVDAATGVHIWAQRYDRDLEDIFAVQDEVTETVVGTLAGRLETVGAERARKKPTTSLTAFDYLLQGRKLLYRYNREDNAKARDLLEKAIALDPDYAEAHAWLSETYMTDWDGGWTRDPDACLKRGTEIAQRAVAVDDGDSRAQAQMGWVLFYLHRYEQARQHIDKALALNPHDPDIAMILGFCEVWRGHPEVGLAKIRAAMRLDPFGRYGIPLGIAHYSLRNYEDAVAALNSVRAKLPMVIAWRAAGNARLGQDEQARSAADAFVEVASAGMTACGAPLPHSWLDFLARRAPYKRQEDVDHYLDGLRKAGLR